MRAFVTGGTGFIGRHIVGRLLARGDQVTVLTRDPDAEQARALARAGAQLLSGDITRPQTIQPGMAGADLVFHVAAWNRLGVRDASPAHPTNVVGTENVLSLAIELDIPRIIYISTTEVYGNTHGKIVPPQPVLERSDWLSERDRTRYLAHRIAELYAQQGAPVIIVCPSVVCSSNNCSLISKLIRALLRGNLWVIPGGDSGYSLVHIEDVVTGILLAADKGTPGELYVLSGTPLTNAQLVELVGEISDRLMPLVAGSATVGLLRTVMTWINKLIPAPPYLHPETLALMDCFTNWVSFAETSQALGYTPRSVDISLRDVVLDQMSKLDIKP